MTNSELIERLRTRARRLRQSLASFVSTPSGAMLAADSSGFVEASAKLDEEAADAIERLSAEGGERTDFENAPRDREIMLFARDCWYIGRWDDDRYAKKPRPFWHYSDIWGKTGCRAEPPTAWRHLPAPPSVEQGPEPDTRTAEETAQHRLHLVWRLRNDPEFGSLSPIAGDEIKQAAGELELAAHETDAARREAIEAAARVADIGAESADECFASTNDVEVRRRDLLRAATCRKVAQQIRALSPPVEGE